MSIIRYFCLLLVSTLLMQQAVSFAVERTNQKLQQNLNNDASEEYDDENVDSFIDSLFSVFFVKKNPYLHRRIYKKSFLNRHKKTVYGLCANVDCHRIHSNGQVSKTWRIAQLVSCCPALRNKKNRFDGHFLDRLLD